MFTLIAFFKPTKIHGPSLIKELTSVPKFMTLRDWPVWQSHIRIVPLVLPELSLLVPARSVIPVIT